MQCCCRYIWSLYWSVTTLATVGYGDLHAYGPIEAAFILCYMLFGIILNAYILGELASGCYNELLGISSSLPHLARGPCWYESASVGLYFEQNP